MRPRASTPLCRAPTGDTHTASPSCPWHQTAMQRPSIILSRNVGEGKGGALIRGGLGSPSSDWQASVVFLTMRRRWGTASMSHRSRFGPAYDGWARTYDDPGNGIFALEEPLVHPLTSSATSLAGFTPPVPMCGRRFRMASTSETARSRCAAGSSTRTTSRSRLPRRTRRTSAICTHRPLMPRTPRIRGIRR